MSDAARGGRAPQGISRRRALQALVGTALVGRSWVFAVGGGGRIVRQPAPAGETTWTPVFFGAGEARDVAALAEGILPRTDTPGAIDARVHEYLDLALSVEPEAVARRFRDGLGVLVARSRQRFGRRPAELEEGEMESLLGEFSDAVENGPVDPAGGRFFADLKRRTVFGYYTSLEGRTEELGLPDHVGVGRYRGCPHTGEEHG